ncbi:hypothetical protein ACIRRA_30915 [Nocardia sp. NPDC101769]|uniref:AMP-binding enzyme n=1 Tax=Nocardia sp. NPDC101769 TaxID=3364333 RepID=UPI0037F316DF
MSCSPRSGTPIRSPPRPSRSFIVTDRGATLNRAALADYCATNLAHYKQPRDIQVVGQLPKTAANKIDRLALRRMAANT